MPVVSFTSRRLPSSSSFKLFLLVTRVYARIITGSSGSLLLVAFIFCHKLLVYIFFQGIKGCSPMGDRLAEYSSSYSSSSRGVMFSDVSEDMDDIDVLSSEEDSILRPDE